MRKRSNYRPRAVISDPLSLLRPASKSQRDMVYLQFLTALEEMSRGTQPAESEWRSLSDAVNVIETLMVQGRLEQSEVEPYITASVEAMVHCGDRWREGKGMRLDGLGLEALRAIVEIYRECMEQLTEREMAMAQAETQRRLNEILRKGSTSREVVMV